jgi:hypothetical protein
MSGHLNITHLRDGQLSCTTLRETPALLYLKIFWILGSENGNGNHGDKVIAMK